MSTSTEPARLSALKQLNILDTPPNESLDRVTRMAAQIFDLPVAAISLTDVDRQWFKSRVGLGFDSIPRKGAPCAEVAIGQRLIVIDDMRKSATYAGSHLAGLGMRFYAGAPLMTHGGHALGALCVLGTKPRAATDRERSALSDLAGMVMSLIEMQHSFGHVDSISGMPNRTQFLDDLEDLAREYPGRHSMAVLVEIAGSEEMDQAAQVMGSRYHDEIVQAAACTIRSIIGKGRQLYHVASTQFAFMAPDGTEKASYERLLRSKTKLQHETLGSGFLLSPRIGVTCFELGKIEPREILREAHSAAQSARTDGEIVRFYSCADNAASARRYWILSEFKEAIPKNQLRLLYQPRIDLATGRCVGAEALVRWHHPEAGTVSPAEFVPIIEGTSSIRSLTAWVVDNAVAQSARWRALGTDIQVSLNVSPSNLEDADFEPMLYEALGRHGVPADRMELELTEGAVIRDGGAGLIRLRSLSSKGVRLAIDDFGIGYATLSYLQKLPVDVVKIDRSFLADLATNTRNLALVKAMIPLCRELGYRVVAEGIEDVDTWDIIKSVGCEEAQGYLFGRPMSAEDIVGLVAAKGAPTT
jgi:EAL domain-containing protein (putative c-di-GMP-specific phosphodiesterase class I)/GGDEF domain-containing protein